MEIRDGGPGMEEEAEKSFGGDGKRHFGGDGGDGGVPSVHRLAALVSGLTGGTDATAHLAKLPLLSETI